MTNPLNFNNSEPFTIGVELEFQLLDLNNLNLSPAAPALLQKVPSNFTNKIKPEFYQSMVEVATGICHGMPEVEEDLRTTCRTLEKLAREGGCTLLASSLHPFADYKEQTISSGERYAGIMEELQIAGRRLITQGMHVHIGMPDGDTAVRVCDAIRPYLPILLALTTSSPFYGGEDTGFYSYRSRLLDGLARSGIPQTLGSWPEFQKLLTLFRHTGIITDIRDIWWDVRPHPILGTIEVRVCDLPSRFDQILAITALVHSLVITLASRETDMPPTPNLEIMTTNKWQAARYGLLAGKFIDPDSTADTVTMADAANDLMKMVHPVSLDHGTLSFLGALKRVIGQGTSAARQKMLFEKQVELTQIIDELRGDFWS